MYVVIVGCGRVGARLAASLSEDGHNVVVVDNNAAHFRSLPPDFSGFTIKGDAADSDVMRQAKVEQADAVVAVTRDDNLNLLVSQAAKVLYSAPVVLARCYDPEREDVYRALGVETVSPTSLTVAGFLDRLERPRSR
jgi:trk system potassium uptake protein TrkA